MTMKRLKLTSPGVLLILAIAAAGGIILLDVFYLHPRVLEQEIPALHDQFLKTERTVELALRGERDNLVSAGSVTAGASAVTGYLSGTAEAEVDSVDLIIRRLLEGSGNSICWLTDVNNRLLRAWEGDDAWTDDSVPAKVLSAITGVTEESHYVKAQDHSGPVRLTDGLGIFARHTIPDPKNPSQICGYLLHLKILDRWTLQKISATIGGDLVFVPADALPSFPDSTESTSNGFWKAGEDQIMAAWIVPGLSGRVLGYFQVKLPVTYIHRQAVMARRMVLISLSLSLGLAFLVVIGSHILVGGPVVRLLTRLQQIESGEQTAENLSRDLYGEPLMLARRLESAFEKLAYLSKTDQLTNLANRRHFEQVFQHFYQQAKRYNRPLSLAVLDIDFFKAVNDTAGHAAGDELLKLLSSTIEQACRKADLPARLGGDEFAVLFPETTAGDAATVLERIRKSVCAEPLQVKSLKLNAALSIGVTDLNAGEIDSADAMLALADRALYAAKQAGRNRVIQAQELDGVSWDRATGDQQARNLYKKVVGLDGQFKGLLTQAIEEIVEVLGDRDPYLARHSRNVRHYAGLIAQEMGLPERVVKRIKIAAMVHDIGMLAMPDSILLSSDRLTFEQMASVRRHPLLSVQVMEKMAVLEQEIPAVRYHHERYDGKGYPEGIEGTAIPLSARILAVADAFDAMTAPDRYRKNKTRAEAIDEIRRGTGTQFDPNVVESFLAVAMRLGDKMAPAPEPGEPRIRRRQGETGHPNIPCGKDGEVFRIADLPDDSRRQTPAE